jgi:hypothetical protein
MRRALLTLGNELLALGNEHVLKPFDLKLVRRSRVSCSADDAPPAKRIAFFHPPKCGGTSVRHSLSMVFGGPSRVDLASAYAAARTLGIGGMELCEGMLAYFVQRHDVPFISGHFCYSRRVFAGREDEFDLITILRNPLDRMLSHYYFARFKPAPDHFTPVDCELSEYLLTDRARLWATTFTRMFVGEIDNLSRFAIVGTLEHVEKFEEAVQQRYKTRFSIGHLRKNPKAGYPKFSDQPSQVRDLLMELCQEDIAIYERFSKQPRPERRFGDLPKVA